MKWKRWIKLGAWALGALIFAWLIVGGLLALRVGHREEFRHRTFQRASRPQSLESWRDTRERKAWVEWTFSPSRRPRYEIRLYHDGRFLCSVWRFGTPSRGQPDRFVLGEMGEPDRQRLLSAVDESSLQSWVQAEGESDTKVLVDDPDRGRLVFVYDTQRFTDLPPALRALDDAVHAAVRDAGVRPPRDYTDTAVEVEYGPGDIENLVRGLESDRKGVHAHVVQQLVRLGEVVVPHLARVLEEGETHGYRPIPRYVAVIDGLAAFPAHAERVLPVMRQIAAQPSRLKSKQPLQQRAQAFVDDLVTGRFRTGQYDLASVTPAPSSGSALPADLRGAYDRSVVKTSMRLEHEIVEGRQALLGMGPDILPWLRETLRRDRFEKNRYNRNLIEILAELGGNGTLLAAVQDGILQASVCIPVLVARGDASVPDLLLLLDDEDRYAHHLITEALAESQYRRFQSDVIELLHRKLKVYPSEAEPAVQRIHRDTARNLITVLKRWDASDSAAVEVLVAAATDEAQHVNIRLAALDALAEVGPAAGSGVEALRTSQGYADRRMYRAIDAALEQMDPAAD